MFRREWRQQILVIALLTVAVAAATTSVAVAYNSGPLDYAEFGSGDAPLRRSTPPIRASLRKVSPPPRSSSGRRTSSATGRLPVPGSVETVEFRAPGPARTVRGACATPRQLPGGPRARSPSPTASRRSSGWSSGRTLALDGHRRTVVGIVENPRQLSDEFALVSPASAGAPDTVTVMVDAEDEAFAAFREALGRPVPTRGAPASG